MNERNNNKYNTNWIEHAWTKLNKKVTELNMHETSDWIEHAWNIWPQLLTIHDAVERLAKS